MELSDYLKIVRRRWALIAVSLLIALAAAAAVTITATPQYSSTARLFVSTPRSAGSDAYQGGLFSQQRVASYADLVTGEDLANRVVDRLKLDETGKALADQVTSHVVPETTIMDVTVTDPSPQRAQQLAATLAEEFTNFVPELETAPGSKRSPIKATIVDSPDVPSTPVSPRPLRNLALAGVLGLLLGLGLALVREMLDTTIKSPQDVTDATDAAILGTIMFDTKAQKNPLVTQLELHAPRVESFKMLRTNLQFVEVDRLSKVFVITSAVPSEGKTTTAVNLSITLAQAGQRVLLVEGDLRRPRVADYLHLEATVGLTTVLIGRIGVEDSIQPWGPDGLHVITSGSVPPNPAELLQSHVMQDTLVKLRDRYDVIIIDAPPLLPVTDAALIASQADGAVLVFRHGKTTKDQALGAAERLHSVDARILGCVLNMAPERGADSYAYAYGYGYAPLRGRRRNPGAS